MAGLRLLTTARPKHGVFNDLGVAWIDGEFMLVGTDGRTGDPYTLARVSLGDLEALALRNWLLADHPLPKPNNS